MEQSKHNENSMHQKTRSQTHYRHTHHLDNLICMMTSNAENEEARANMILLMTANIEHIKARNAKEIKGVRNAQNRTCQTHRLVNLIRPTEVTINVRDTIRRRAIIKRTLSNHAQI